MKDSFLFSKIYLNCRRGMLELDIILTNFLESEYSNMDGKVLVDFCALLCESDNNLYLWLVKRAIPSNNNIIDMVNRINYVTDKKVF
ncbi:MAG TPA: succinate dehydrogenase assembly factor 2 [Candidatus Azoamicus sp. OHIO1]